MKNTADLRNWLRAASQKAVVWLPIAKATGSKLQAVFVVSLLLCGAIFSGCGYTTRSMIYSDYKTIHVDSFVNKIDITSDSDTARKYRIYSPGLETDITKVTINKFMFDGNLKPVKSDTADLLLKGELVEFRRDPLRYTEADDVQEYRVNIVVNISLWDNKEHKLLWEENNFTGDVSYFTSGTLAKSESTAINDALNDLARRIVERVVEQW